MYPYPTPAAREVLPRVNITVSLGRRRVRQSTVFLVGSVLLLAATVLPAYRMVRGGQPSSIAYARGSSVLGAAIDPVGLVAPVGIGQTALATRLGVLAATVPDTTLSVATIDSRTGQLDGWQPETVLTGASTTKLITATAILRQIEAGQLRLSDRLGGRSVEEHLELMVNQSNNDSWDVLNTRIGLPALQRFAHEQGWRSYRQAGNQIAAGDLARLLYALAQGRLLSGDHTERLLSWMTDTNEERMLPSLWPGAVVQHKYGWLEGNLHDAAIIRQDGAYCVVVVMTSGATMPSFESRAALVREAGALSAAR